MVTRYGNPRKFIHAKLQNELSQLKILHLKNLPLHGMAVLMICQLSGAYLPIIHIILLLRTLSYDCFIRVY